MHKQLLLLFFLALSNNLRAQSQFEIATFNFKEKSSYTATLKISFDSNPEQDATLMILDNMFILKFGGQKNFSDGNSNFTYSESANELIIRNIDSLSPLLSPRSLLNLDKELFNIVKEEKNGIESIYTLKPKNNIADISSIDVIINNSKLKELIINSNTNNHFNIKILNVDFNPNLKKQQFIYYPRDYKNVEIIDFR